MRNLIRIVFILLVSAGCDKQDLQTVAPDFSNVNATDSVQGCDTSRLDRRFVFHEDNRAYLIGGDADSQHFDVSSWELNECNLRFGFCREHFPAVYQPRYESVKSLIGVYDPEDKFILVRDKQVKAYSMDLMVKHEAVNDTINGHPILVAYCVLADYAVVYDRMYCSETLTYALSGYTYADEQSIRSEEAFVMWDRETESLWLPLSGAAVSGPMSGQKLTAFLKPKWSITTWSEIEHNHTDAKVLARDIHVEPPIGWRTIDPRELDCP